MFRLMLAYTKEITILKSQRTEDGKLVKRDTEEAIILERDTRTLPRITSTLSGYGHISHYRS